MRPAARIAFASSLAANAAALYLLVPAPAPVVEALREPIAAPVPPPALGRDGGDAHAYLEALLERGLSQDETKPLLLARLSAASTAGGDPRAAGEYWRSNYSVAVIEEAGRRVTAADSVRATLLALYGPGARHDPVFAPLFAPLDSRYAFLASEHQLALQKLQLQRLLARAKSAATPAASATEARASNTSATVETFESLRSLLGPGAALEYVYRLSPLADQLRSANLDLSGAEFRGAFETLLRFETAAAEPQAFARTREALRTTLGDARFTRLWAVRDPYFGALAAAGRQQGLAEGTLVAAYSIFNDAQDRLAAAADRYAAGDPQRAGAELHGIQEDVRQRLVALVGEDAASALERAVARLSVSMQTSSSTNPRE